MGGGTSPASPVLAGPLFGDQVISIEMVQCKSRTPLWKAAICTPSCNYLLHYTSVPPHVYWLCIFMLRAASCSSINKDKHAADKTDSHGTASVLGGGPLLSCFRHPCKLCNYVGQCYFFWDTSEMNIRPLWCMPYCCVYVPAHSIARIACILTCRVYVYGGVMYMYLLV